MKPDAGERHRQLVASLLQALRMNRLRKAPGITTVPVRGSLAIGGDRLDPPSESAEAYYPPPSGARLPT
jgi:hypothetical protein